MNVESQRRSAANIQFICSKRQNKLKKTTVRNHHEGWSSKDGTWSFNPKMNLRIKTSEQIRTVRLFTCFQSLRLFLQLKKSIKVTKFTFKNASKWGKYYFFTNLHIFTTSKLNFKTKIYKFCTVKSVCLATLQKMSIEPNYKILYQPNNNNINNNSNYYYLSFMRLI